MKEADRRRGRTARLLGSLAAAAILFAVALVALLAWKTRAAPWELVWLDDGRPSALLLGLLHESRHAIAALAFAASNLVWMVMLLGRGGKPTPAPEVCEQPASEASGDEESPVRASGEEARAPLPASRSAIGDPQLEIAATELSRLRRELGACRLQLDAANAVKSQFLANMSHELRTPMNGIMGMTDLLLAGELPARERRFAQSIASSSNSLLGVISDLLDFSRIESGTLYLERSRFRMRDAVEDVCAMLAESAHGKGIELVCYVDDNVPSLADGDATRLRQVLDNLVRNAIAFTTEGEIVVRMSRVEERGTRSLYRCDVQDTGSGISPEMQMTMFDAFTQEDSSNTRRHGGLGMGLTISRQLVSMMGGELTFRSRLGEGTRFGFTVEFENVEGTAEEESRHRPIRGTRVLVVDDNETNRTILYHQLSGWGIVTDTAESGEAALARLHAAAASGVRYDMLVLDLHMPGMDGVELARRIRADETLSGIRSLMLTSALLDLDTDELAALGIDRYISKPPRQSVLHDSLVSLLPVGRLDSSTAVDSATSMVPISAHVLIAEDNIVSQDVAVGMLESVGCRVDVAGDGREAIARADDTAYDLILMDCRMPGIDGYEATATIRAGEGPNARTPIVALTANVMQGDRERCLEVGMDDYLAKPVRCDDLHVLLMRWVELAAPVEMPVDASSGEPVEKAPSDGATDRLAVADTDAHLEASPDASSTPTPLAPAPTAEVPATAEASAVGAAEPDAKASGKASGKPLVNLSAIDAIRGLQRPGKPDLLAKVLGVYFDKTPAIVEAMQEALEAGDAHALKEQAHSLKSSSAYVGAEGLSDKCRRIERAAADDDVETMGALVTAIAEEFEMVSVELGTMAKAA